MGFSWVSFVIQSLEDLMAKDKVQRVETTRQKNWDRDENLFHRKACS